ncbi:hypothetical protein [Rhizobium etli]|uniref:Cell division septum initiation protein DivIVA n=1 Tax=Rhizobium etli TaxID=29449 RepID=A0A7W6VI63_RHIET|nr:hypothetical protein [Rhizobium etli]MBB4483560.1 cell division septum initiation protein DivIVA [Rhizobium etli]MBB4539380.1 cell division septum initiation protein DivIVA [Rhizobium etli]
MIRPGEPTVEELMARIAALQAENRQLKERVLNLEEELALGCSIVLRRIARICIRCSASNTVSHPQPLKHGSTT